MIEISIDGPGTSPRDLGLLDTEVGAACFAHGRDAGRQRARHALGGKVEVHRERRAQERHRVEVAVAHEVHVAVDEARAAPCGRCSRSRRHRRGRARRRRSGRPRSPRRRPRAPTPLPSNTSPPRSTVLIGSTVPEPCGGETERHGTWIRSQRSSRATTVIDRARREAEQLGYTSFWVNDIPDYDGLASLAAASASTTAIKLGVGVIPLDERTPADIDREHRVVRAAARTAAARRRLRRWTRRAWRGSAPGSSRPSAMTGRRSSSVRWDRRWPQLPARSPTACSSTG